MAQTRFVRANQVPAGTRFTRAAAPQPRQPQSRPDPAARPPDYTGALGGLAGIGSRFAPLVPGSEGVGAGLGLLSTGLSLPNLFSDRTSTPRKILGGAQALTSGVSNLNALGGATGLGSFLSPGMASGLGTAGGALGIGSGALGLAEGRGPSAGAEMASGAMALMGLGGPAALFALPGILGPLLGGPADSAKRDTRRGNAGASEVASLMAPAQMGSLDEFLSHPQLSQAATIADWMNRGGAEDLHLGPTAGASRLVDQLRSVLAAGYTIPKWQGPQNLEALSFVGGADPVFDALSQRLGQLGFPGSGQAFEPPLAVDVPGFAPPESGPLTTSRQYMDPRDPGRPWAPDPLFPIDLGNVTRAQLEQYRPAYNEQLGAGGTTAKSFEDWAARQLARNWGLYTDAGTPPVRYTIAG